VTKPRIRQLDIASEADVSEATVSRVFNRPEAVSEATRERVYAVSRRLGFGTPVQQTLGLIVPDASNPFFSQLIYHFERELRRHGAHLVSASAEGRTDKEVQIVDRFRGMGVEGIFYTPARNDGEAIVQLVSRGDLPVLAFDRQLRAGNLDCVTTSPRMATQMLVDYLVNLGHERFGYIAGARWTTTAEDRFEAFSHALAKNGIVLSDQDVFPGNYRVTGGRDYAETFLLMPPETRPTAVVAGNDLMALGFIQRVQETSLRVPEHVSVAGFDGIDFGAWYSPSLTTISQPVRRLVREATTLLLARIDAMKRMDEIPPPRTIPVEPRFVARDSVGPAPSPTEGRRAFRVLTIEDDS
jgi:DNA-binding LacI/PurR family transcriptional regulator